MNAYLQVSHLSFRFPQFSVFQDVSFSCLQGEWIGIIGPNGGGKTTLLRLLLGFLKPQSGAIAIEGKRIDPIANRMSYVPQSWKVDCKFPITVCELVLTGFLSQLTWYGRYSQKQKKLALQQLEELGMGSLADMPIEALSGGQIQRTLLARALVSDPKILLLDEFTAHIDPSGEETIFRLLQKKRGFVTIFMVTHDLQAAIHRVDRVLCVQNGIASLSPDEVCEHFAIGLYHPPLLQPREEL